MRILLQLFLEICFCRKGPQDVPHASLLFALTALAYLLVGTLVIAVGDFWSDALLQTLTEAAILIVFSACLLWLYGKFSRWQQTLTTLFATDVILSTPALPILLWLQANPQAQGAYLALFTLMIWHMQVVAHILRHALSSSFIVGAIWSIVYTMGSFRLMTEWFPAEGG